jgi:hypothetical protein
MSFRIDIDFHRPFERRPWISANLVDSGGAVIVRFDSRNVDFFLDGDPGDTWTVHLDCTEPWLRRGAYALDVFLLTGYDGLIDERRAACRIEVLSGSPYPFESDDFSLTEGVVLGRFEYSLSSRPAQPARLTKGRR